MAQYLINHPGIVSCEGADKEATREEGKGSSDVRGP
jgi:hypothetical protein